ncbi:MAG: chemotaxis protein CheW [Terriglobia bacterium]|nr:chemotaxis protein CheW [Terriglobia bacterium]
MKISRQSRKHAPRRGEAAILFAVGGFTFAAPATEVDEIRDLHGTESMESATEQSSVAKVVGTLERSGRTHYVVDGARHFRVSGSNPSRLMILRSQPIAVRVESIDRMAEIGKTLPLPKAFRGDERRWYRGLVLIGEQVVPVVHMASFLTPAEQVIAKATLARAKGVPA